MHSLSGPEIKGVCSVEVLLRAQLKFKAALYSKQTTHSCSPKDALNGLSKKEKILFQECAALQSSRRSGLKSLILE